jgi:small conductance mechanosensitive channel
LAVVDVSVAYEEDLDNVERVLKEIIKKAQDEVPDIVAEPQLLGVHAFGPMEVIMRVTAECKPNTHHGVSRKLRAMIKREFDARGIEIPYPRLVFQPKGQA